MPIVTLKYNLPDEAEEFKLALKGAKLACVIDNLYNHIRTKIKYEDQETINLEELREWLTQEMDEIND